MRFVFNPLSDNDSFIKFLNEYHDMMNDPYYYNLMNTPIDVVEKICKTEYEKTIHILKYLHYKGENVMIILNRQELSVSLLFPNGIKNKIVYDKLISSKLIKENEDKSVRISLFPRNTIVKDAIVSILFNYKK